MGSKYKIRIVPCGVHGLELSTIKKVRIRMERAKTIPQHYPYPLYSVSKELSKREPFGSLR